MRLWARMALGLVASVLLAGVVAAEEPPIITWSFNESLDNWLSIDPNARLLITNDVNIVREGGDACLEYAYTPAPNVFSGVMVPLPMGLGVAHSVHFWVRPSDPTFITIVMAEGDGSRYSTSFYCLPESWQEITLGLGEFAPTADSQDENEQLDPWQVNAILIADASAMFAQLAEQVPFIAGPHLGPRMLWLDNMTVEVEDVEPRWEVIEIEGHRAVRLESFETAPLQWLSLAGTGVDMGYDQKFATHGDYSLRIHYNLPEGKIFGLLTSPQSAPLQGMKRLRFAICSEVPIVLLIELKERDESKFNTTLHLASGDQLEDFEVPLTEFALADDSQDENNALDIEQVKELLFADISFISQNAVLTNTLWLDDIVFSE
ncbi:MAG: hypothetical protein ACUVX8_15355 [Candidatus Zipacnadales bacterium]